MTELVFIVVGIVSISSGVGMLYGQAYGWIVFGVGLIITALSYLITSYLDVH